MRVGREFDHTISMRDGEDLGRSLERTGLMGALEERQHSYGYRYDTSGDGPGNCAGIGYLANGHDEHFEGDGKYCPRRRSAPTPAARACQPSKEKD